MRALGDQHSWSANDLKSKQIEDIILLRRAESILALIADGRSQNACTWLYCAGSYLAKISNSPVTLAEYEVLCNTLSGEFDTELYVKTLRCFKELADRLEVEVYAKLP